MVLINSTEFGSIIIDHKTYDTDVIVSWDGKIKEATTVVRHLFGKKELDEILKKKPELIIIGTGDSGFLKVSDEIKKVCSQKRIELIELISKNAIAKFNENASRNKKVVAFIHVTC